MEFGASGQGVIDKMGHLAAMDTDIKKFADKRIK